jgi:hypothetical protein
MLFSEDPADAEETEEESEKQPEQTPLVEEVVE